MATASELVQGEDKDSPHASSPWTDRRQLAAISPERDVLAATVLQPLPTPGLPSPKTDFLSMYGALQRASKVLTSALHRDVASAAPAGALKQLAREYGQMNDVLAALQQQLADAKGPFERLQHEIWCPPTEQATRLPCIHDDEYWYERGDLLLLKFDIMCSALRARQLTDAARFAAYIRSTWDSHTVHMLGRICEIVDLQTADDLMRKMMHLASHLMSIPDGAPHALRTVVWLKSHVTRCNVAFTKADVIRWPQEADTLFDQLLVQPRPKDKPVQSYDCATPRRELWHAYNSASCRSIAQTRARQLASPAGISSCFHISSERMLYVLNINAHREIEEKVWLAVGTHLPEELNEEVVLVPDYLREENKWELMYRVNDCV
ncbi:hypothetical protein LTR91_009006 [Friedmanniomyces endolithicus]|uniref:Uncharacterized protein n=1 Tax=Friedmanniomyces endolithicus TaxID=329885 RepID=A0AAN6KNA2_9PEZI|nr:hypothetical protein LTR35_006885 [Friedmanniomyces endolithicus]KAK0296051.1 hypothetical protein LTS00_005336 [Friedmanniomyces endolithicus]KAK0327975.1 hypothetical protein LTR82_001494 [Friedmanniomyces endolithicus]KAK0918276.1 hypothetical protein LTR57_011947 [Friedmanniomyces endolithicus]KAK0976157.1 hypothetical protein LTS01_013581 [Friedmanniomyces endolithicus]